MTRLALPLALAACLLPGNLLGALFGLAVLAAGVAVAAVPAV